MIHSIIERLKQLPLFFKTSSIRWLVGSFDYLVMDHLVPWSQLNRQVPSTIHPSVSFRSGQNIYIGAHTRVQSGCVLWSSPNSKIVIGDYTGLGPGTMIFSSNHQFRLGEPYHRQPWTERDVVIGRDVWIGAGTMIMPGVTIGDCCVVAAGSVVTRDIPSNSLVGGVPARIIRARDPGSVESGAQPENSADGSLLHS